MIGKAGSFQDRARPAIGTGGSEELEGERGYTILEFAIKSIRKKETER